MMNWTPPLLPGHPVPGDRVEVTVYCGCGDYLWSERFIMGDQERSVSGPSSHFGHREGQMFMAFEQPVPKIPNHP